MEAANGIWTNTVSGGLWSNSANWSGGIIADGSGFTANFGSLNLVNDDIVHLDSSRTLSSLIFSSGSGTSYVWTLDNNGISGNTLNLSGSPTISVTNTATISANITGVGFVKNGIGTLILSGNNTFSGQVSILNVNSCLQISSPTNLGTSTNIIINQNSGFRVTESITLGQNIDLEGGNPTIGIATGKILTINGMIYGGGTTPVFGGDTNAGGKIILNASNYFTNGIPQLLLNNKCDLSLGNQMALNGASLKINSSAACIIDNSSGSSMTPIGIKDFILTTSFAFSGSQNLDLGNVPSGFTQVIGTTRTINILANTLTMSGILATGNDARGAARTDGSLVKTGSGTLIFKSNSTYTGSTSNLAGVFQIGGLLASTNVIVNAGTLFFTTNVSLNFLTINVGAFCGAPKLTATNCFVYGTMTNLYSGSPSLIGGSGSVKGVLSFSQGAILTNILNSPMTAETVYPSTGMSVNVYSPTVVPIGTYTIMNYQSLNTSNGSFPNMATVSGAGIPQNTRAILVADGSSLKMIVQKNNSSFFNFISETRM